MPGLTTLYCSRDRRHRGIFLCYCLFVLHCCSKHCDVIIDNYIKCSLFDFLLIIKTAEAFEAVDWLADLPQ